MDDFWLVKTDEFGNIEWNRTYGGEGREVAQSMVATADGGYALAGYTDPPGMDRGIEFLLVKTDEAGNVEWNQTYDGIGSIYGGSLVATSDGGYALVADTTRFGAADYDVWLAKTDSSGNLQWSQTYGGTKHDYGYSVIETSDGGYAMAGFTYSFGAGQEDFWLVKTDASGNLEWNQTYGGLSAEHAYSVVEAADGGYAIAGSRYSIDGDHDFLWIRTDEYGNSQMPESGQEPDHEDSNQSPTNIPEIIAVIGVVSAIILLIYLIIRKQKIKT
jgi:hypothetical protein